MKAYKGFNKDMTCRGYQYEEGKTYETDKAELCKSGFHACEAPIDCLRYYLPSHSVYHRVELEDVSDERGNDSKACGKKITIGARLTIDKLVDAQIQYIKDHSMQSENGDSKADRSVNSATEYASINSTTGECSANSTTGYKSANVSTGNRSANSATERYSVNSATGYGSLNSTMQDCSANSTTGFKSANTATGYMSTNSATGDCSVNNATGDGSVNVSTGYECSNIGDVGVISVGWGKDNRCCGAIGSYMVLCERGGFDGDKFPMIGEPVLVKVDGEKIKANTWYCLKNGKVVEWDD